MYSRMRLNSELLVMVLYWVSMVKLMSNKINKYIMKMGIEKQYSIIKFYPSWYFSIHLHRNFSKCRFPAGFCCWWRLWAGYPSATGWFWWLGIQTGGWLGSYRRRLRMPLICKILHILPTSKMNSTSEQVIKGIVMRESESEPQVGRHKTFLIVYLGVAISRSKTYPLLLVCFVFWSKICVC